MRPGKNIEKIIKKFDVDINPDKDRQILQELQHAQAESKQPKPGLAAIDIWRIIMKSRITKFSAVVVLIIAVFLCKCVLLSRQKLIIIALEKQQKD